MKLENIKEGAARYGMAALIAGAALFGAVGTAQTAYAATATTDCYITADDSKIVASAPTRIDVTVNADGTFNTPSPDAVKLTNGSIFGIHVADMTATEEGGFNLVEKSAFASTAEDDAIWMSLQPGSGTAVELGSAMTALPLTGTDWNLAKADASGTADEIGLTSEGAIANVTKDLSTSQQFASVNWTFEAGTNA